MNNHSEALTGLIKQLTNKSSQNTFNKQPTTLQATELLTTVQDSNSDINLNPNNNSGQIHHTHINPRHNPAVKNDHWRQAIMIICITTVLGYLLYKYGWNSKLPF